MATRELNAQEAETLQAIKDKGDELFALITSLGVSRELEAAKNRCEESVMWATLHLTHAR